VLTLNKKDGSLEVLAKIVNSVAKKYQCTIRYDFDTGEISTDCDGVYKMLIAEEVINIFKIS
jgi:hypothetical protein